MILWWLIGVIVIICFGLVVFIGAPYVPSKKKDLEAVFTDLYKIGKNDLLVDIGSGDGVVLREAAARGAKAVGYEINPFLVIISNFLSRKYPSIVVKCANFWQAKLPPETTIVYTFGDSRDIEKMAKKVTSEATRLGKPLYFLSLGFALKDQNEVGHSGPYFLYQINPLQSNKP